MTATRAGGDPVEILARFREQRDALFATHPQSALDEEQQQCFRGLDYFARDAGSAVEATIEPAYKVTRTAVQLGEGEAIGLDRIGVVRFQYSGHEARLALYWLDVYGGGLFVPFRDGTAPDSTYGGGRYLFDTIKGSDFLALRGDRVVLDFNYAYNPSCAYNYRWVCPLAPPENHLPFPITAGKQYSSLH